MEDNNLITKNNKNLHNSNYVVKSYTWKRYIINKIKEMVNQFFGPNFFLWLYFFAISQFGGFLGGSFFKYCFKIENQIN